MGLFTKNFFSVFAGLILLSLSSWAVTCPTEIKIGWEPYPPFQEKTKSGEYTGVDFDLAKEIFGKMACKYSFVEVPWARVLKDIESGVLGTAPSASKTPEREKFAIFSDSYVTVRNVLIVKKGEAAKYKLTKLEELAKQAKFRLGVTRSYEYGEAYAQAVKSPQFKAILEEGNDEDQNIKKLVAGRVNGMLANEFTFRPWAKKAGVMDQLEIHPLSIGSDDLYFMFSKKSMTPEVVTAFNATLKEMRGNGTYDKIISKYLK